MTHETKKYFISPNVAGATALSSFQKEIQYQENDKIIGYVI